jgi:hypothetical protein
MVHKRTRPYTARTNGKVERHRQSVPLTPGPSRITPRLVPASRLKAGAAHSRTAVAREKAQLR